MGKLWTFGDSFTYGSGLHGFMPEDIFWYGQSFSEYIFPKLVANHLDLVLENHGMPGENNLAIIREILKFVPEITPQDVVIIGLTCPARYPVFTGKDTTFTISGDVLYKIVEALKSGKETPIWAGVLIDTYSIDELQIILDYYLTVMPRFFDQAYLQHLESIQSIQKLFLNRGIKCLIWDRTTWESFENIETWTRGLGDRQVYDGHWSPNGNLKFAEIVKRSLLDLSVDNPILITDKYIEFEIEKDPKIFDHLRYIEPHIPVNSSNDLI